MEKLIYGPHPTVAEARCIIHDPNPTRPGDKIVAAATLVEAWEDPSQVSLDDLLRCLDYPGATAEIRASSC